MNFLPLLGFRVLTREAKPNVEARVSESRKDFQDGSVYTQDVDKLQV